MTREIALTRGKTALVDEADLPLVMQYRWRAYPARRGNWYAVTQINRRTLYMHRLILGTRSGKEIDHINRNGLDNRRANLRFCSHAQNSINAVRPRSVRPYRGVRIDLRPGRKNRYSAQIRVQGKIICGASRATAIEAACDYDDLALRFHGEFAVVNRVRLVTES